MSLATDEISQSASTIPIQWSETILVSLSDMSNTGNAGLVEPLPVVSQDVDDTMASASLVAKTLLIHRVDNATAWCYDCNEFIVAQSWKNLLLHCILFHLDEARYFCTICDFKALQPQLLELHFEHFHPESVPSGSTIISFDVAEMKRWLRQNFDPYHPCPEDQERKRSSSFGPPQIVGKRQKLSISSGKDPPDRYSAIGGSVDPSRSTDSCDDRGSPRGRSKEDGAINKCSRGTARISANEAQTSGVTRSGNIVLHVSNLWKKKIRRLVSSTGSLLCNICNTMVQCKGKKTASRVVERPAVLHVLEHHLQLPYYHCVVCKERIGHESEVSGHVRKHGQIEMLARRRYMETVEEAAEIARKMGECFTEVGLDQSEVAAGIDHSTTQQRQEPMGCLESQATMDMPGGSVRSSTSPLEGTSQDHSTLSPPTTMPRSSTRCPSVYSLCSGAIESQIACGFLHCFVCRKDISVTRGTKGRVQSKVIDHHALSHTSLPIYNCRHCTFTASTPAKIKAHLQKQHHLGPPIHQHFQKSETFREEILDQMRRCFDPCYISDPQAGEGQRGHIDEIISAVATGHGLASGGSVTHNQYPSVTEGSRACTSKADPVASDSGGE